MHLVTLCGSLRARSSNQALLQAFVRLAPPEVTIGHYDGVGALPHFNPDRDTDAPPAEVGRLRAILAGANAVVISTPEYAHGLPGAFKNLLDWLVSDPGFAGKKIAILHVDRGSIWALDSLREILRTMSAEILSDACVALALGTNTLTADELLGRPDLRKKLEQAMTAVITAVRASR